VLRGAECAVGARIKVDKINRLKIPSTIHNAGVGGSSPPVATNFLLFFSILQSFRYQGSPQLSGADRFSPNPVDDAIPPAVGHDSQSIVLEVSEPVGSTAHHLHLVVKPLRGSVALADALHHDDGLKPECQSFRQPA